MIITKTSSKWTVYCCKFFFWTYLPNFRNFTNWLVDQIDMEILPYFKNICLRELKYEMKFGLLVEIRSKSFEKEIIQIQDIHLKNLENFYSISRKYNTNRKLVFLCFVASVTWEICGAWMLIDSLLSVDLDTASKSDKWIFNDL